MIFMLVNLLMQLGQWSTDLSKLSQKLAWIGRWLVLTRSRVFLFLFKLQYAAWWHQEVKIPSFFFGPCLMLYLLYSIYCAKSEDTFPSVSIMAHRLGTRPCIGIFSLKCQYAAWIGLSVSVRSSMVYWYCTGMVWYVLYQIVRGCTANLGFNILFSMYIFLF